MLVTCKEAIEKILSGEIVGIPTDTVYGIAALPFGEGSKKMFNLKGRPIDKPFLLLVDQVSDIEEALQPMPKDFWQRVTKLWPGAFSLILPTSDTCALTKASTLGFRIPDHEVTREILRATGPLFVTSANISGQSPACSSREVEGYFGENFPVVQGEVFEGVPSTIVECEAKHAHLIRRGVLSEEKLREAFPTLQGLADH